MDLKILKDGIENEIHKNFMEELEYEIEKLNKEICEHPQFHGNVVKVTHKILRIGFHQLLTIYAVFDEDPGMCNISFERLHFSLTHMKLKNNDGLNLIRRFLNDELYIVEYPRFLSMLFPSIFVKIMPEKEYNKKKKKYLGKKKLKIYTGSRIIQETK